MEMENSLSGQNVYHDTLEENKLLLLVMIRPSDEEKDWQSARGRRSCPFKFVKKHFQQLFNTAQCHL